MLDIYLIRHGESEMNCHCDLVSGRSNHTPLTEKGRYQAALLGDRLAKEKILFGNVYSSTAVRAAHTADIACSKIGYSLDEIIRSECLLELDQGDWVGQERAKIYTPEMVKIINSDNWNFKAPNGESQKEVEERMYSWLEQNVLSRYKEELKVGIFTHGVAIKCLLRGILNFDSKHTYLMQTENTSITRLKYDNEQKWRLISFNDIAHLL